MTTPPAAWRALHALCRGGHPMALREASARVFQGRSKLLDSREDLLRLLGAAPGQFFEAPRRLRSRTGCRLYLRTPLATTDLQPIESWLFCANDRLVSFFGDLDYAGMQILASLREVFPQAGA